VLYMRTLRRSQIFASRVVTLSVAAAARTPGTSAIRTQASSFLVLGHECFQFPAHVECLARLSLRSSIWCFTESFPVCAPDARATKPASMALAHMNDR